MLKDVFKEDIGIFLDLEEFGELAELDGVLLPMQVDSHTAAKSGYASLMGDFLTIYFEAEPYYKKRQKIPRKGEWCRFRGKRYDVAYSQEEKGMVKLVLSAYRQNMLAPRAIP